LQGQFQITDTSINSKIAALLHKEIVTATKLNALQMATNFNIKMC